MRTDGFSKGCVALLVGLSAAALVACGSGDKNGSTLHGGAGTGGSAGSASGGTGGNSAGGTGGSSTGGTGGQGGASGGAGGQATGGAGGASSCSDFGQTKTCTDCLVKNCCAESAACSASADCKAFIACNENCPNPLDTSSQCVKDCASQHPPGGVYNTLLSCMENQCTSPTCNYM